MDGIKAKNLVVLKKEIVYLNVKLHELMKQLTIYEQQEKLLDVKDLSLKVAEETQKLDTMRQNVWQQMDKFIDKVNDIATNQERVNRNIDEDHNPDRREMLELEGELEALQHYKRFQEHKIETLRKLHTTKKI